MQVHHPRLAKRRYLLLKTAPKHFRHWAAELLSSFGLQREFSLLSHIPTFIRGDASRIQTEKQRKRGESHFNVFGLEADRRDYVSPPRFQLGQTTGV